ncbi:MAG TPA: hypothetical protein VGN11_00425 [Candidatus Baltobacteraceae bacterium]|jgi:2-hydroxychromene-2-carboxylate isomerase|nr:hypothetical protein [Candidatus Baltobacteraceae bacterium]
MRAVVFLDVLSHWCLASVPAVAALIESGAGVEIILAPLGDGAPLGMRADFEAWCYTRGTRAYGMELRSDWYEGPESTTWHANAAVLAGAKLGGDLWRIACAVMSEAMQGGAMFGRAETVNAFVAELGGVEPDAIAQLAQSDGVAAELRAGNRRLAKAGGDERPTFRLENGNGDFALLKGLWQRDAALACAVALAGDEAAYAAAGAPPPAV